MYGWEPREIHRNVFARIWWNPLTWFIPSAVEVTREAEFDGDTVTRMLAHLELEADRGPHGQLMSRATDPRANPSTHDGWHYEARPKPANDYAAQAIARAQETYYEANPKQSRAGHLWTVHEVQNE